VTIVVPQEGDVDWAAVENVIKKHPGAGSDIELGEDPKPRKKIKSDDDEEL